jgi:hypothetical protein
MALIFQRHLGLQRRNLFSGLLQFGFSAVDPSFSVFSFRSSWTFISQPGLSSSCHEESRQGKHRQEGCPNQQQLWDWQFPRRTGGANGLLLNRFFF